MKGIMVLALIFSLSIAAVVFTAAGRVEEATKRIVRQLSQTSAEPCNK
jgi:hypothetical protein